MALHHHLSLWQKVLLGIFCFPFLPFYLCYLGCTGNEEEEGKRDEEVPQNVVIARVHYEDETANDTSQDIEGSQQKQHKRQQDSLVLHRNKVSAGVHYEDETANDTSQDIEGGRVTFVAQPNNTTPQFFKKLSFGKGKRTSSVRGQDNRGFTVDGIKTAQQQTFQKSNYVYPWDRSSLKSLDIHLAKFAKLDDYASRVDVKGSVENLVMVLLQEAHTELEKVRAIFIWICHHIEYDTVGFHNKAARSGDPKDILQSRKGVCAGYAGLFLQMCSVVGVKCKQISGYSKGYGYLIGQKFSGNTDHAWNAVYLEGRWHLLDSTWAAGNVNDNCTQFKFDYNEFYFLTHPSIFIESHYPEDPDWQLLSPPLSLKQFENNMRHHNAFYSMGLLTSSPDTPVIKTVNGKSVISVEGRTPTLFTFHVNGDKQSGLMTLNKSGMKLEVYPKETGTHTLQIYAKLFSSSKNSYDSVLEYKMECSSVDKKMKIPTELKNPVGPSWLTEKEGFHHPSHPEPIIHTPDGRCSVSFTLNEDLDVMATLHTDDMTVTEDIKRRHIFKCILENQIVLKIQLPQAGTFVLGIYHKNKKHKGNSYDYGFNYLLSCTNAAVKWPVFPLTYASWLESYELVEPTAGVLPANRNVHFKLKVPGVNSVFVKGKGDSHLTLSGDGYWEGSVNTSGCRDVNVMIEETGNTNYYHSILNYLVETL
ncbi:kyphoscoliosis peptidase-like isoform X2 [Ambystoma mexicanum]|uniref:kyphoscoliosis peptidase-like isoform X2 n=1 Tax=Ambystoma mexicanum TaxID=8296 RepID=UPI0037E70228